MISRDNNGQYLDKNGRVIPVMDKQDGRRVFQETVTILDRLSLPFFLVQGTALGAYRDQGFTPTERDIDFGVLVEHFSHRAEDVSRRFVKHGFSTKLRAAPFDREWTITAIKDYIKVDIVSFLPWVDRDLGPVRFNSNPTQPYSIVHPAALLEDTAPISLFGCTVQAPSPIEEYLTREYGDWKTPRHDHVSKTRVSHYHKLQGIPDDYLSKTLAATGH